MLEFARYASEAREALMRKDTTAFAKLMDQNFTLRRKIYGDEVIGPDNLRLIGIANKYGHSAKFSGSGGCVIGIWKGDDVSASREVETRKMRVEMQRSGKQLYE
jgi:glucuronokinase